MKLYAMDRLPGAKRAFGFSCLWFIRIKWAIVQLSTTVLLLTFLVWLSVFLYGCFHYQFMPTVTSFEHQLYLQFRTDCDATEALCSFPSANLSLVTSRNNEILVRGQPYNIRIELEMPESYVNQRLGMFMVRVQFYTTHGSIVYTTSRTAMMQFKSFLYRIIETLWSLPWLLFKYSEQKQIVVVEMGNDYRVDPYRPTLGVFIEVQSKRIEIYNSSIKIHARLSGLRYLLFYWPTVSAVVGIATNFFFLSVTTMFSYLAFLGQKTDALHSATATVVSKSSDSPMPNRSSTTLINTMKDEEDDRLRNDLHKPLDGSSTRTSSYASIGQMDDGLLHDDNISSNYSVLNSELKSGSPEAGKTSHTLRQRTIAKDNLASQML